MQVATSSVNSHKVSFLLSLYDAENPKFFDECLKSISEQTYNNFEVVVVYDGPINNELVKVVNKFVHKMDVKVVQLDCNSGLAKSLNYGLSFCEAEFIARLDTDDAALPERLEKQVSFLLSHPEISVLGSGATVIDLEGNVTGEKVNPESNSDIISSLWCNPIIHPSVMFRKSEIINNGGYDESLRRRQDYELWFRLASNKLRFHNLNESLIYYRFDYHTIKKQNFKLNYEQGKIGFKGSLRLGLPLHKALLCFYPCFRIIFPDYLQRFFNTIFRKFDPRRNTA
ncbi:glycosyltransferase [Shewanella sp. 10N.261.52.F9]|uniref:glycosyltransferase n=1 Tax=Shewanella sp. 10N.261.52.F9 TaxID=3229684 RepID=UPI00355370BE